MHAWYYKLFEHYVPQSTWTPGMALEIGRQVKQLGNSVYSMVSVNSIS